MLATYNLLNTIKTNLDADDELSQCVAAIHLETHPENDKQALPSFTIQHKTTKQTRHPKRYETTFHILITVMRDDFMRSLEITERLYRHLRKHYDSEQNAYNIIDMQLNHLAIQRHEHHLRSTVECILFYQPATSLQLVKA